MAAGSVGTRGCTHPIRTISGARLTLGRNPVLRGTPMEMAVTLTAPAVVDLNIFDIQGRLVASLFHGRQEAGTVNHSWVPAQEFSSGLYFVRMHTGGQSLSRKVVMVR